MVIKKIDTGLYDIFLEDGWANWTRIKVEGGRLIKIAGQPLPKGAFFLLKSKLLGQPNHGRTSV